MDDVSRFTLPAMKEELRRSGMNARGTRGEVELKFKAFVEALSPHELKEAQHRMYSMGLKKELDARASRERVETVVRKRNAAARLCPFCSQAQHRRCCNEMRHTCTLLEVMQPYQVLTAEGLLAKHDITDPTPQQLATIRALMEKWRLMGFLKYLKRHFVEVDDHYELTLKGFALRVDIQYRSSPVALMNLEAPALDLLEAVHHIAGVADYRPRFSRDQLLLLGVLLEAEAAQLVKRRRRDARGAPRVSL